MEEEQKKLQKKFINDIHAIAKQYPKMLDLIITDEVLVWCLVDINKKLSDSLKTCLEFENVFIYIDSSKKISFNLERNRLKEYYDLFLTYDNIRKKRNMSLYFIPTTIGSALALQHILEQDENNESLSRK